MIEIITIVSLILLVRLLFRSRKKKEDSSVEKENKSGNLETVNIIGESTFVLGHERQKQSLAKKQDESAPDSSGKMDIEVPLDYEPDNDLLEELEELGRLGLQTGFSSDITFDEMMSVVNEVGKDKTKAAPKTGKLLYENENTDWVEQLSLSSEKNTNRITALIDLHLGRLAKIPKVQGVEKEKLIGFNISDFISHNKESLPNG